MTDFTIENQGGGVRITLGEGVDPERVKQGDLGRILTIETSDDGTLYVRTEAGLVSFSGPMLPPPQGSPDPLQSQETLEKFKDLFEHELAGAPPPLGGTDGPFPQGGTGGTGDSGTRNDLELIQEMMLLFFKIAQDAKEGARQDRLAALQQRVAELQKAKDEILKAATMNLAAGLVSGGLAIAGGVASVYGGVKAAKLVKPSTMEAKNANLTLKKVETAQAKVDTAKADLGKARTDLKGAEGKLSEANTKVDTAKTKVEVEQQNVKKADAKVSQAQKDVEKYEGQVKEAKATGNQKMVDKANQRLDTAKKDLATARNEKVQAEGNLNSAQKDLDTATGNQKLAETEVNEAKLKVTREEQNVQAAEKELEDVKLERGVSGKSTDEIREDARLADQRAFTDSQVAQSTMQKWMGGSTIAQGSGQSGDAVFRQQAAQHEARQKEDETRAATWDNRYQDRNDEVHQWQDSVSTTIQKLNDFVQSNLDARKNMWRS